MASSVADTITSTATVVTTVSAVVDPAAIAAGSSWPIFSFIRSIIFQFLKFWTYTLPTTAFGLINTTLTFTISLTTLCTIGVMVASMVLWVVRYRVLNVQPDVAPEPQRQQPEVELPPEPQEGDSKPGLSSYLDEFLSAIKIFGYLERPVFHELTRSMQTRKLIAGETFLLEEEKGFCLVVDGLVQIFTKASRERQAEFLPAGMEGYEMDSEQERDSSGYQLLTEVKNGAPMSSLFTILSLFTEDVTLKREDSTDYHEASREGSYMSGNGYEEGESFNPSRADQRSSFPDQRPFSAVPPMSLSDDHQQGYFPETPEKPQRPQRPKLKKSHSVHPDIIARASVDTTIAVIPASAFRRLTRVYPKASGHIVQVILTRFQRVTFLTAYSYLGLTSEVLRTEKLMSYYTNYQLPNILRGTPLDKLKKRFDKERERLGPDEDESKGIALHKNDNNHRRRSSATLRKEVAMHARIAAQSKETPPSVETSTPMKKSYSGEQLETPLGTARSPFPVHNAPPFSQGWTTSQPNGINLKLTTSPTSDYHPGLPEALARNEDKQFQDAVSDCLFKALGLNQRNGSVAQRTGTDSGDHSPRLVSYGKQKAVFSNAFGFIDPYEGSHDGDTESVASTGAGHSGNAIGVHEELKRDVDIVFFPKGSVLVEQGERNPGIYYVIDGFLDVGIPVDEKAGDKNVMGGLDSADMLQPDDLPPLTRTTTSNSTGSGKKRKTTRKSLYMVKPGGVAGYMGSISAYRSFVDVRAQTDVYVGFVPASALERIVEKNPVVLLTMAKRLTSLLPRLILHIDFALEWLQVSAGQVVYHQEEESDAIYIVLNGRMRAILEDKNDGVKVVGEYGQGESVGELEVLTESTRPATLHAIRDTELAKFPKTLFNSLALEHPGITIQISKIIASRMRSLVHGPNAEKSRRNSVGMTATRNGNNVNLRTVAILPVTAGVPVTEFAHRLTTALHQTGVSGNVAMLNQTTILNHLGRHAFSRMGKLKLAGYLADLEEKYGMVLYVCDTSVNSPWTQTCIAQADEILLVALSEGETSMGEYERVLLKMGSTARKSLVLIHGERFCREGLTRKWLENRRWISGGHHHIQMSFRPAPEEPLHTFHHTPANKIGSAIKQRVQILQAEIFKYTSRRVRTAPQYVSETPFKSDFHRLARRLCGKAIGLVLGGGGARGLAHVGIIRAMEDSGIPIDVVAGTSIGALIGGLYARDADIVTLYGRAKQFASRMASTWRMVLDLTYPAVSYTTGWEFNRTIFRAFSNSQIEDFWLPFFCNTTNITQSRMQIHTSGIAWRPIRASMSLAGLLPPLPDAGGDLLLDGGYVDNLPVDSMRELYGTTTIFAIDVSSVDDSSPHHYGDSLSGWWVFVNRWNPFKMTPNPPTLAEIQQRLAYVSSVEALEKAKVVEGVVYCRVPVEKIGTLEFARVEEVVKLGFDYAKRLIEEMRDKGELEGLVPGGSEAVGGGKTGWRGRRVGRRKSI